MDIRVLKYFVAVAKEKNITRAAESLHLSQPSLSKQLINLEDELGKQLLIRKKRRIDLSEDGLFLLKRAEEIIALLDQTQEELSHRSKTIHGKISIGGMLNADIQSAITTLHHKCDEVTFEFFNGDATDVMERLDHGSLDFAVLLKPIDTVKYEYISLTSNAYWGLLMPKNSPFAKKECIEKEDLCTVPLIFHRRVGLQQEITHWAQTELEKMNIVATYNILTANPFDLVKSGLGYLLTSNANLPTELDQSLCFKALKPKLEINFALVWKRNTILSKQSKALLKEIQANKQTNKVE